MNNWYEQFEKDMEEVHRSIDDLEDSGIINPRAMSRHTYRVADAVAKDVDGGSLQPLVDNCVKKIRQRAVAQGQTPGKTPKREITNNS